MEKHLNSKITWSADLAYVVGLLATDGNLSKDGRHIIFVSKDLQLIKTFQNCIGCKSKISRKISGYSAKRKYYYIQFSNVALYKFLLSIGLTPAKSKTLGKIKIPKRFFADFVRGLFDGDGSFYSYLDKRWKSSFMFYLSFCSASLKHLTWLKSKLKVTLNISGYIDQQLHNRVYQLKYAKRESKILIKFIYYKKNINCLERKYKKINLALIKEANNQARVL